MKSLSLSFGAGVPQLRNQHRRSAITVWGWLAILAGMVIAVIIVSATISGVRVAHREIVDGRPALLVREDGMAMEAKDGYGKPMSIRLARSQNPIHILVGYDHPYRGIP